MMSAFLVVAGVGVFSFALRSFRHPTLHRLGTLGIFITSFLAGWLIGGELWLGAAFAVSWLLLPWLEILTHVRRMRLPLERSLAARTPPARSVFPGFAEFSEEAEEVGFEYVQDTGWDHEDHTHFFRLFYDADKRVQAAICLVEQGDLAFYYLALTSRGQDGRVWMTWNYPFSYGLKLPPRIQLNRVQGEADFQKLLERHEAFLAAHQITPEQIAPQPVDAICESLERDLRDQIFHNIDRGLLVRDGETLIRYSTRGLFFLWFQFLRDFVRLS